MEGVWVKSVASRALRPGLRRCETCWVLGHFFDFWGISLNFGAGLNCKMFEWKALQAAVAKLWGRVGRVGTSTKCRHQVSPIRKYNPLFLPGRRRVQRLMQAPHLAAAPIQAGNLSTPCIVRPVNLGFFDSSPLKHAFCSAQLLGVDWSGDWKAEFTEFVRWLRDNYKEICTIFWQRLTSTWFTRNTSLITKMSYSECQIGHHNNILKAQTYFMILIF